MSSTEPPEMVEAGDNFQFFSEVIPVSKPEEIQAVPSGERVTLVATVPKYGLLLVAIGGKLNVYNSTALSTATCSGAIVSAWCGGRITHVTRTCDCLTVLVVAIWPDDTPHILAFDVRSLIKQDGTPYLKCSSGSSQSGARVSAIVVNPTDPGCLAVCTNVGDFTIISLTDNSVGYNTKKSIGAGAIGWSAKGKQVCVGCSNGSLALFKPDLSLVRTIAAPPIGAVPVTAILWFTNTEFFVAYQHQNLPYLAYVNGPKDKPPQFVLYDDVCYSSDQSSGPHYYHLSYVQEWNQVFAFSSGGVEMGVLVKGGNGWCQVSLDEGNRAEMHFVNVTQETYPLGLALDFASNKIFSVKEDRTAGPLPVFYSLSTGGELNAFHANNKFPGAPDLCAANRPQTTPAEGAVRTQRQYNVNVVMPPQQPSAAVASAPSVPTAAPATSGGMFQTLPNPASSSMFGSATSSESMFGSSTAAAPTTGSSSLFGGSSISSVPGGGGSLFGGAGKSGSLFGGAGKTGSLFSNSSVSSSSPVFGTATSTVAVSGGGGSLFAPKATTAAISTAAAPTMFGGAAATQAAPSSAAPPFSFSTGGSLFSGSGGSSSVFGGSSATTTAPQVAVGSAARSSPAPTSGGPSFSFPATSISQKSSPRPSAPTTPTTPGISAPIGRSNSATPPPAQMGGADPPAVAVAANASASRNFKPPGNSILADRLTQSPGYSRPAATSMTAVVTPVATPTKSSHVAADPIQTPAAPLPRTAQQNKALLTQMKQEQDVFDKELKDHFRVCGQCEYKGGWEASMGSIQEALQSAKTELSSTVKNTDSVSVSVTEMHTQVLEFYSAYEDAKSHVNRLNDPKEAVVAEWRGLDRCSERQLQQLRSKLHYIQSELGYANATLDTLATKALNASNKASGRTKGSGGAADVYRTVLLTHNVRVACEKQLDSLSAKMRSLNMATPPHMNDNKRVTGKYGISDASLLVDNKENLNTSGLLMTPDKQKQLWHLLQQRKTTPVRKSGRPVYTTSSSPSVSRGGPGVSPSPHTPDASLLSMSMFGPGRCSTPTEASTTPNTSKQGLRAQLAASHIQGKSAQLSQDQNPLLTFKLDGGFSAATSSTSTAKTVPAITSLGAAVMKTEPGLQARVPSKYENITPPGTPDVTAESSAGTGGKAVNPLLALSSLVGKVPPISAISCTTTVPATVPPKTPVQGFFSGVAVSSSTLFGGISKTPNNSESGGIQLPTTSTFSGFGASNMFGGSAGPSALSKTELSSMSGQSLLKSGSISPLPGFSVTSSAATPASVPDQVAPSTPPAPTITQTTGLLSTPVKPGGLLFSSLPKSGGGNAASVGGGSLFGSTAFTQGSMFGGVGVISSSASDAMPVASAMLTTPKASSVLGNSTPLLSQTPKSSGLFGNTGTSLSTATGQSLFSSIGNNSSFTVTSVASSSVAALTPSVSITLVSASTATHLPPSTTTSTLPAFESLGTATSNSSLFAQPSATHSGFGVSSFVTLTNTSTTTSTTSTVSSVTTATASPSVVSSSGSLLSTLPTTSSSSASVAFASTPISGSLFGASSTSGTSLFGSATAGSLIGAPSATSANSMFGGSAVTSVSSVFGAPAVSASSSAFGTSSATTSTASAFGATGTVNSANSLFSTPTSTPTLSAFGSPAATSSASVFGTPAIPSSTPAFGIAAASTASGFGVSSAPASSSVFGAPATSGGSLFGSSSGSAFGVPATTSSTPAFGSCSVFGSTPAVSATSGGSLFGNSGGTSSGSVFGSQVTSSVGSSSVFNTAASSSPFGDNSGTSGSNNNAATSSVFGAQSTGATPSVFGGGGSVFGGNASGNSAFGGGAGGTPSVFGGAPATTAASVFGGSNSASAFGSSASGGSSLFGNSSSMFSGLGSKPTSASSKNVFGVSSSTPKPQNDLFGGGGNAAPSVFGGATAAPAKPASAFGGAASFGSPPKFGSAAEFGSPPAFGSSGGSVFGGGGSVFGGTAAPAAGGSAFGGAPPAGQPTSGGFSSFANSPGTATFGGLANGSGQGGFGSPANNAPAPFASPNIAGGNQFTSWR